ncbi:MAG: UDP-N-acetylmuramoyl-tripeptide--D-alanyl-D-alanine ligase [Bacteroidales bacterium]|nr:UDP-N-acetylmuramoyl-tripeptide--D-alanyl-D-alanine ligase [Bacteroidales bacterium]
MMKLQQLIALYKKVHHVVIDSRNIRKPALFFALKGEHYDANQFAEEALNNGAVAAVVDDQNIAVDQRYILVDDALVALQRLAAEIRKEINVPVIAITGSNGKTTTKELADRVLAKKYHVSATQGNLNNHIGVPLTILNAKRDSNLWIIEMGANHQGEIATLCQIAQPNYGIITNLGNAHLQGFGSIEGVRIAKTELYRYLHEKSEDTVIFYNADDEILLPEVNRYNTKRWGYGSSNTADLKGNFTKANPFLQVTIEFFNTVRDIPTKLIGSYNLPNILAAASFGTYFGVAPDEIANALSSYQPDNNRSQFIDTGKNIVVMDAYNANPSSVELALDSFHSHEFNQKMVVLGDMLELGSDAHDYHRNIYNKVKEYGFDAIFVGPVYSDIVDKQRYPVFTDTKEASRFFIGKAFRNRSFLLKGSRGIGIEALLQYL